MNSFEMNKILGAVLGTCLGVVALNIAAGAIFAPEQPAKPIELTIASAGQIGTPDEVGKALIGTALDRKSSLPWRVPNLSCAGHILEWLYVAPCVVVRDVVLFVLPRIVQECFHHRKRGRLNPWNALLPRRQKILSVTRANCQFRFALAVPPCPSRFAHSWHVASV